MANNDSAQYVLRYNEISQDLEFGSANNWTAISIANAGISQLTGVVLAGPGSGSQVTTFGTIPNFALTGTGTAQVNFTETSGGVVNTVFTEGIGDHRLIIQSNGTSAIILDGVAGTITVNRELLSPAPYRTTGDIAAGTLTNDPSAVLLASSTTQGFLPPRMTATQRDAISSPAEGLNVYDITTHLPAYWNGSAWIESSGGSPAGSDTQIQFNSSGSFSASSNFTYNELSGPTIGLGTVTMDANSGEFDITQTVGTINIGSTHGSGLEISDDGTSTQVYFGDNSNPPDVSAVLDLDSVRLGFLCPRMTTTQKNAIVTPAESLMVYDLTLHKLSIWTGAAWETITSA